MRRKLHIDPWGPMRAGTISVPAQLSGLGLSVLRDRAHAGVHEEGRVGAPQPVKGHLAWHAVGPHPDLLPVTQRRDG